MALERQSIEKRDFPIGRRGYDPEAVDAHLSALADEVDELKLASRRRSETLAEAASEQVRAIVEAAERGAQEIQHQAEDEARDIRAEATAEAQATRERAGGQARDYVGRVSESTAVMLQRLDAMESEVSALIQALRAGANRLTADLGLLEANVEDVAGAVTVRPRFEPEGEGAAAEPLEAIEGSEATEVSEPIEVSEATEVSEPTEVSEATEATGEPAETVQEFETTEESGEPEAAPPVILQAVPDPEEQADVLVQAEDLQEPRLDQPELFQTSRAPLTEASKWGVGSDADDLDGARLIALNMALNGTPREETDRYLADNFELHDRASLLDEVYDSVES